MRKNLFTDFVYEEAKPAMETIDFQPDNFGKELDGFFENLLSKCKIKSDILKYADGDLLSSIIKKYTSLKVKINFEDTGSYYASIYLPSINANHLFLDHTLISSEKTTDIIKYQMPALLKAIKENNGKAGVDTKNGRVYGAFQDIESELRLPPSEILYQELTARELTATVLHEIGHLFNYYRYFSQTYKTNQVLSFISTNMTKEVSFADREEILYKTMGALGVSLNNVKELAEECNSVKIILALAEQRENLLQSELNSWKYDITANEQMADMYVARHGYGKEMVSNLSKSASWENEEKSVLRAMSYLTINADLLKSLSIAGMGGVGVAVGATMTGPVLLGIISVAYASLMLFDSKTNKQSFTYDKSIVRFKRIREQLISYLKTDRSKDKVKEISNDIKEIDYLISILLPERTVFNMVADYLFSESNQVRKTMVLQRHLEELASNDLFLGAAKLTHAV